MFQAIAGKRGLAPGVSLLKFRWFLQDGQNDQTHAARPAAVPNGDEPSNDAVDGHGASTTASVEFANADCSAAATETELGPEGMAALRAAITEVGEQCVALHHPCLLLVACLPDGWSALACALLEKLRRCPASPVS